MAKEVLSRQNRCSIRGEDKGGRERIAGKVGNWRVMRLLIWFYFHYQVDVKRRCKTWLGHRWPPQPPAAKKLSCKSVILFQDLIFLAMC